MTYGGLTKVVGYTSTLYKCGFINIGNGVWSNNFDDSYFLVILRSAGPGGSIYKDNKLYKYFSTPEELYDILS